MRRAAHPAPVRSDNRAGDRADAARHAGPGSFVETKAAEQAARGENLAVRAAQNLRRRPRVVPDSHFVQHAVEAAGGLPRRHGARRIERRADRGMLNAVEPRRERPDRQRRVDGAVEIQLPGRAVVGGRHVVPRAVRRNRRRAVDRVIPACGRVFEVGRQPPGRRADAQEVIHVDGAALDFRHPLGDERNRRDAAGAGEGRHARAVAPDPRLRA